MNVVLLILFNYLSPIFFRTSLGESYLSVTFNRIYSVLFLYGFLTLIHFFLLYLDCLITNFGKRIISEGTQIAKIVNLPRQEPAPVKE